MGPPFEGQETLPLGCDDRLNGPKRDDGPSRAAQPAAHRSQRTAPSGGSAKWWATAIAVIHRRLRNLVSDAPTGVPITTAVAQASQPAARRPPAAPPCSTPRAISWRAAPPCLQGHGKSRKGHAPRRDSGWRRARSSRSWMTPAGGDACAKQGAAGPGGSQRGLPRSRFDDAKPILSAPKNEGRCRDQCAEL